MKIVLLGPPGAGKGTQAKLISSATGLFHISTGQIFRNNMETHSELGERVREVMESGNLVSDDLTNEIVSDTLSKLSGYILDGYPRSLPQAQWFDEYCKVNSVYFLFLDVSDDVAIERMMNRTEFRPESDTPEKIQTRLDVYRKTTEPCVNHYKDNNVLTVIKDGTIEEVWDRVKKILGVY